MKRHLVYFFGLLIIAAVGLSSCQKTSALENKIVQLESQLSKLQKSLESAQNNSEQQSNPSTPAVDLSDIEQELADLQREMERLKTSQPASVDLSGIEQRIKQLETLISQIQKSLKSSNSTKPSSGIHEWHNWVDLGLSVKWATCNIGAKYNQPEDYGNYYAWGELEGCDRNGLGAKSVFTWNTYFDVRVQKDSKYGEVINWVDSKYLYSIDTKELEYADDVARQKWGGTWRMPTIKEFEELINKCTSKWTTQNGVNGMLFSNATGQSIFLPATSSSEAHYWSRSLSPSNSEAGCLYFYSNPTNVTTEDYKRYHGLPIRAVCTASE